MYVTGQLFWVPVILVFYPSHLPVDFRIHTPQEQCIDFELKRSFIAEDLETLVSLIRNFFEKEVSSFPGFVSAKIHQNEEGKILINYATWESSEAFDKFVKELASISELSIKIRAFNPT